MRRALPFAALVLLAAPAAAQELMLLGASGRAGFETYRAAGFNKAFAMNRDGRWAYQVGSARTPAEVVADALRHCNEGAREPCEVVSFNDIATAGRDPLSLPAVDPRGRPIGALTPSPFYPIRGPDAAAGLVVWSHGVQADADNTNGPPHGYLNRLRDAGYDFYDFDRRWPNYAKDLATLQEAVGQARAAGYRRVVLAGQSVGAWLSLEAAAKGAPVDAAAAPARFGKEIGSPRREQNREELMPVLDRLRQRPVAAALMFFAGDEYDPGGIGARARDVLARGGAARVLLVDGPPEVNGHGGGGTTRFAAAYGACIADFLLMGERRRPCAD
jgi:dienelactone hydrolase